MESLLSAFAGAQAGRLQLAAAARLARTGTDGRSDTATSVAQLVGAAQHSVQPLADAAAGLGTRLDVSC
jgi:hypothetical protein